MTSGKGTLGEQAYQVIRESILFLRLEPGQMIYESELAEMLDMSRTPIREAVRMLLIEELIYVLPQRGMRIALISEKKVIETQFVRESLEISGLKEGIEAWDQTQASHGALRKKVQLSLETQKNYLSHGDMEQFLRADEAFHELLMGPANNQTLVSTIWQMRGHLNRVRMLSLRNLKSVDSLVQEHEEIIAALLNGQMKDASTILTNHLRRVKQDLYTVKQLFPTYFTN